MPKGIPYTEAVQAGRRQEVFHKVAGVFAKKGFLETSMREIAQQAQRLNQGSRLHIQRSRHAY